MQQLKLPQIAVAQLSTAVGCWLLAAAEKPIDEDEVLPVVPTTHM